MPDSCCVKETVNCGKNEAKATPDPALVHTKVGFESSFYKIDDEICCDLLFNPEYLPQNI